MSKYLIQDIIPPERKRRGVARSGAKKSEAKEHTITHPEHPVHLDSPVTRLPISEAFPENPRQMIADQMIGHDNASPHETSEGQMNALSHQSAKMITPEHVKKAWSYDFHTEEETETSSVPPPPPPPREKQPPRFPEYAPMDSDSSGRRMGTWMPWLIGGAIAVIAGVLLLNYFGGATVTIVPKNSTLTMDEKFSALKNGGATDLPYAVMTATTSLSIEVPATGEKTVTTKASGSIVIYNEQTVTQRLIKNTRFQTPAGNIYRINDSITVPKASTVGGKLTPGSLTVTVYADEAGPEYNSDPTDFTLPGLKDSPTFKKVYARSNGPLSGGASGTIKTVSDQDLKQAGENLRVQLETKLRSKARGDLAPSQVAYDQGVVVDLNQPSLSNIRASAANKAVVSLDGRITLVVLKRADLAKAILKRLVENYAGEDVDIKNLDTLQFSMTPQTGSALMSGTKIDFALAGTPQFTWVVDQAAVKNALLGVSKANFTSILGQFPSVERAQASIHPMWQRSFSNDPNRISVVLVDKLPE